MSSTWGRAVLARVRDAFARLRAAFSAFADSYLIGREYFGRVDQIPGTCHVQSAFDHVLRIPLFPQFSVLVLPPRPGSREPEMLGLPFRWKSLAFAYARVLLVLLAAAAAGLAVHQTVQPAAYTAKKWKWAFHPDWLAGASGTAVATLGLSFWASRATGAQKAALLQAVGKLRVKDDLFEAVVQTVLPPSRNADGVAPIPPEPVPTPRRPAVPIALPPILGE